MVAFRCGPAGMNEPLNDTTILRDKTWLVFGAPGTVADDTPGLSASLNK